MKVVLLGMGNVGHHLVIAFKRQNIDLIQIYNRTPLSGVTLITAQSIPFTTQYTAINPHADLYIIAVKDDAITKVAKQLTKQLGPVFIAHTSGAVSTEVLAAYTSSYGSFYPLQTFSKRVKVDFENIPLLIDANTDKNLAKLEQLANSLAVEFHHITNTQREVTHVASVLACNFTNYLLGASRNLLLEKEIPYEIIHPLIEETIRKGLKFIPQSVQTGPAIRNDKKTINKHLGLLENNKTLQDIYQLISKAIIDEK